MIEYFFLIMYFLKISKFFQDNEDDDVNEVKKVLKDLFQIKLGENKNGDHKEDKTDGETKIDEKISERFCLDPFSTNR